MKPKIGIYKIENIITKNIYIGQSKDLEKRRVNHFSELRNNKHGNAHLQNSFNIHGKEKFIFSALIYCEDFELTKYETFFNNYYKLLKLSYNIRMCVDSNKGLPCSENTRKKISSVLKSMTINRPSRLGCKHSEKTRRQMSKAHSGMVASEQTKEKISKSQKLRWQTKKGVTNNVYNC
jgi:group I intron endonuclease